MRTSRIRPIDIAATLAVLTAIGLGGRVAAHAIKVRRNEAGCADNLRRLGLAAAQYASDQWGRFPHVSAAEKLDGDHQSTTASRVARSLVCGGYLQDPAVLVCPASRRTPGDADYWQGEIVECHDSMKEEYGARVVDWGERHLSYGWTRRALTTSSRPDAPLAADWAMIDDVGCACGPRPGNHEGFMQYVSVDGRVGRAGREGSGLTARAIAETTESGGFMGVRGEGQHD